MGGWYGRKVHLRLFKVLYDIKGGTPYTNCFIVVEFFKYYIEEVLCEVKLPCGIFLKYSDSFFDSYLHTNALMSSILIIDLCYQNVERFQLPILLTCCVEHLPNIIFMKHPKAL